MKLKMGWPQHCHSELGGAPQRGGGESLQHGVWFGFLCLSEPVVYFGIYLYRQLGFGGTMLALTSKEGKREEHQANEKIRSWKM